MTFPRAVAPALILLVLTPSSDTLAQSAADTTLIEIVGTVFEEDRSTTIPYVTVQEVGSGRATMSNPDGEYRLLVNPASTELKFSHVAYEYQILPFAVADTSRAIDIYLTLANLQLDTLVVIARHFEPGMRIIAEAIKRRRSILDLLHDYRFEAYTKTVIRDATMGDSMPILLITEVQSTSYWENPDQYREVITARKQTANMSADDNLVAIGDILDFASDRIELGPYSIPSPTASDAMDHYNFYLIDTVQIDSKEAFRLEMEPTNPDLPRFKGIILIVDSTYDLVDVDLGFSRGVEISMVENPRFGQRFALYDNEFWMPVEMRFEGTLHIKVPQPFIPGRLAFSYIAMIHDYELDKGHEKDTFGDATYEVAEDADDFDSVSWYARQAIRPTAEEMTAYDRIDSLENLPTPPGKIAVTAVAGGAAVALGAARDIYRFNRVEGVYLGMAMNSKWSSKLRNSLSLGYSFGTKRVQHEIGSRYRLSKKRQWDVGANYHLGIKSLPSVTTPSSYNPAPLALLAGIDPFNYYYSQGLDLWTRFKMSKTSYWRLTYHDADHRSVGVNDRTTLLDRDRPLRDNPIIQEGRLRSFEAQLRFDTRPILMNKGYEWYYDAPGYTRFWIGAEHSGPKFLGGDFHFTQVYARLFHRMRTLGLGLTTIYANASTSYGDPPPQRYFRADDGNGLLYRAGAYQTFNEQAFGGPRGVSLRLHHNFQRLLFTYSGIPVVKDFPFWLSVHGNFFWAENLDIFSVILILPQEYGILRDADQVYTEIGFGLENLTPFISPLNLAVHFTWQLSDYNTRDFRFNVGVNLR